MPWYRLGKASIFLWNKIQMLVLLHEPEMLLYLCVDYRKLSPGKTLTTGISCLPTLHKFTFSSFPSPPYILDLIKETPCLALLSTFLCSSSSEPFNLSLHSLSHQASTAQPEVDLPCQQPPVRFVPQQTLVTLPCPILHATCSLL